MTTLTVQALAGLPGLPSTPFGVRKWLKRNSVPLVEDGNRFTFHISDLPDDARRAVLETPQAERKDAMSDILEGYEAVPFIAGQGPEEAAPKFGKVAGQEAMTLTMYVNRARSVQEATALVPYTLGQAAKIFGLIYRLTAAGFPLEEAELCSLAELCQRGLEAVAEKEGEAIEQMDVILRSALSYQAKREAEE